MGLQELACRLLGVTGLSLVAPSVLTAALLPPLFLLLSSSSSKGRFDMRENFVAWIGFSREAELVVGRRRGSSATAGGEARLIFCWKHDSIASSDVMLQLLMDALESCTSSSAEET